MIRPKPDRQSFVVMRRTCLLRLGLLVVPVSCAVGSGVALPLLVTTRRIWTVPLRRWRWRWRRRRRRRRWRWRRRWRRMRQGQMGVSAIEEEDLTGRLQSAPTGWKRPRHSRPVRSTWRVPRRRGAIVVVPDSTGPFLVACPIGRHRIRRRWQKRRKTRSWRRRWSSPGLFHRHRVVVPWQVL